MGASTPDLSRPTPPARALGDCTPSSSAPTTCGTTKRRSPRQTAARFGIPVHELALGGVDEAIVETVARAYGQPFGDSSAIPSWLLGRAISPHRKVVLNGDGGDEIFAGYRRYTLARMLAPIPRIDVRRFIGNGVNRRSALGFVRRAVRILAASGPERYQLLTTDLVTSSTMGRVFPPLATADAEAELSELVPEDPFADGGAALMRADRDLLLAWDLLPKMDIASMAHGVEARSPFLDVDLVAFASSIPPSHVVGRWSTKPLLRALARRHLPAAVARGPKRGFEVPVDRWLAGPLRGLVDDTVLAGDARIGAFADVTALRRLATGDYNSGGHRPHIVWALLMLELFLRDEERSRRSRNHVHG